MNFKELRKWASENLECLIAESSKTGRLFFKSDDHSIINSGEVTDITKLTDISRFAPSFRHLYLDLGSLSQSGRSAIPASFSVSRSDVLAFEKRASEDASILASTITGGLNETRVRFILKKPFHWNSVTIRVDGQRAVYDLIDDYSKDKENRWIRAVEINVAETKNHNNETPIKAYASCEIEKFKAAGMPNINESGAICLGDMAAIATLEAIGLSDILMLLNNVNLLSAYGNLHYRSSQGKDIDIERSDFSSSNDWFKHTFLSLFKKHDSVSLKGVEEK
jgi:hypothetical protein